ncbi:MAG TPA: YidC/Oxa1 family insertase periplasmic-domain containing protein [Gemmatimonadaceae bacterium]|nr:YidC/Oxa1 family insertase periplasmic-domain containing protein [Gemmatimonadaceae bacterium]
MEKRFFLALLLTGVVLVVTPLLVGRPPATPVVSSPTSATQGGRTDSGAVTAGAAGRAAVGAPGRDAGARPATAEIAPPETTMVRTASATMTLLSRGAAPTRVTLAELRSLSPASKGAAVELADGSQPLLRFRILAASDTVSLADVPFHVTPGGPDAAGVVRFESVGNAPATTIEYQPADPYRTHVRVRTAAGGRAYLLAELPTSLASQEADTLDDIRHLAFAAKPVHGNARGITFASVDPGERKLVAGPISWAVTKTKYFVIGLLSESDSTPFAELDVTGALRDGKLARHASGTVVIPLVNGAANFDLYAGPQSWERMRAIGREFETANPYGGFLQPIVQPFATIVMRIMLWMKRVVKLDYGWVLVIFGFAIRVLLWPLNQSAMRSSIRMQRVQPEIAAVQERYKNDKEKLQQEIMRVYQDHGMSPFAALSGCLPALIPMPVFFALFFVFQNTIEFRGVPFLWLSDISLHDPLYVLPLLTGASMFLLSWIGMRNLPKNPQSTTMLYLMPGIFTMFLLNTASGLSIYYLVQQIAAIPQQWMIANERRKAQSTR